MWKNTLERYLNKFLQISIAVFIFVPPLFFAKTDIADFSAVRMIGLFFLFGAVFLRLIRGQRVVYGYSEWGMLLFIGVAVLSMLRAASPFFSANYLFAYLIIGGYIYTLRTTGLQQNKIMWLIVLTAAAVFLMALLQYFQIPIFGILLGKSARVTGTFFNANRLAGYVVLILPLLLVLGLRHQVVLILFLIGVYVLLLTKSRGGFIALYIALNALVALLARYSRYRFRRLWLVLLVLNLVGIGLFWISPFSQRFKTEGFLGGNSMQRVVIWWTALRMVHKYPLLGVGIGDFSMNFEHYRNPIVMKYIPPYDTAFHTHNDYLQFLSETGILGFSLIMLGLLGALRRASLKERNKIAAFAAVIGMLVYELIDFNLHILPTLILFITLIFVFQAECKSGYGVSPASYLPASYNKKRGWGYGLIIAVIFVFFALYNLCFFMAEKLFQKAGHLGRMSSRQRVAFYSRIAKLNPFYDYYNAFLGHELSSADQISLAVSHYRLAAKLHPYKMSYFANLAVLFVQQGHYHYAKHYFVRAYEAEPFKPESWLKRALIDDYMGDYGPAYWWARGALFYFGAPDAVPIIVKAMKQRTTSQNDAIKKVYALLIAQRALRDEFIIDLQRWYGSEALAELYVRFLAKNKHIDLSRRALMLIANSLYNRSLYNYAAAVYRKSFDEYGDRDALYNAGVAYYKAGAKKRARSMFEQLLNIDQKNTRARQILRILENN